MATKEEDVLTSVFVTSTHTPVLFFSTRGQVYKMKVWKLPIGTPTSKGKALINLLPLEQDESISTILPLPEDEETWGELNVIFATSAGTVRRNSMEDFTYVPSNGKIAMKLDEDGEDRLIGVALCEDDDDVLLAARGGKSIRFAVNALRVFKSRSSKGVKGMKLQKGDQVISMAILKGQDASVEERDAYLKAALWKSDPGTPTLSTERMAELAEAEDFILSVTYNGYGKRSSSHEYRAMGRGGQGVANIEASERNGRVIGNFPVEDSDQIIMVTDQGKIIRTPIHDVRVMGRGTQGVTLFDVAEGEHIVSVAKLGDTGDDEEMLESIESESEATGTADASSEVEKIESAGVEPEESADDQP
jgi:DNA gyrase subunit A